MKIYKIFSTRGRASRKEFWCYFILSLMLTSGFLNTISISPVSFYIGIIIGCTCFYIGSAVSIRRLHDIGLPGYLSIILIGSWAIYIVFTFFVGMHIVIQHFLTLYKINLFIICISIMYLGCKKAKTTTNTDH